MGKYWNGIAFTSRAQPTISAISLYPELATAVIGVARESGTSILLLDQTPTPDLADRNDRRSVTTHGAASVRDAEALGDVLRMLQLVEHRCRIILESDKTLPVVVDQELVVGRAVLSRSLSRRNLGGGTQIGPVQPFRIITLDGKRLASLARFLAVDLRKIRQVGEGFAGRDFETARPADIEHSLHTCIPQPFDQCVGIGGE